MKTFKHIALILVLATTGFVLSSNYFISSRIAQLQEVSSNSEVVEPLPSRKNTAFKAGERLTYRLHYGIINAGEAVLEVQPTVLNINGRSVYHIIGTGYSTGTTDFFFKVRDTYETYMDKDALLPWLFVRRVNEGGYKFSQNYSFNHYAKKVDIGNNQKYDVPSGIQDMVSAFYSARNLDLSNAQPGSLYTLNCFLDKEVWPLKIKFIAREIIETDLGKFRCLKFRPIVQQGRVFKKEEDLNVWISDDQNHIVIRAQAEILVGSIKMDIKEIKNLANASSRIN